MTHITGRARRAAISAAAAVAVLGLTASAAGAIVEPSSETVYDSYPASPAASYPSFGFTATSMRELGDYVQLGGTDRMVQSVTLSMNSWACESGAWTAGCVTTPGSTFSEPITFTFYEVGGTEAAPTVGAEIAHATTVADVPFRPSADTVNCPASTTQWYDAASGTCNNGYAFDVTFDFSATGVELPDDVIVSVKYPTSRFGELVSGPWDSLNVNVDLSTDAPSVGTDVEPGSLFINSANATYAGVDGVNTFSPVHGWDSYSLIFSITAAPKPPVAVTGTFTSGKISGFVASTRDADATGDFITDVLHYVDPATVADAPAGVVFPYGAAAFQLHVSVGATATVTATLPAPVTALYKSTGGAWEKYPATIDGTTVTFSVTDGGAGDADGVANGVIVDPMAPAQVVSFTG